LRNLTVQEKPRSWLPLSFEHLKTTSLHSRPSKVSKDDLAKPWSAGGTLRQFVEALPAFLGAGQLRRAVQAVAAAVGAQRTVLLGMGAHPIKVGLSPIMIDALQQGIFTGLAMNGAGIIHDVEMALAGKTSEDVAAHLGAGQFGMARETAEFIHEAVQLGRAKGSCGLGQAVGERLLEQGAPYLQLSILARAAQLRIPVTVHVAFGTDIIHMHPTMDGAAMGELSHYDFRLFCRLVSTLEQGVYINLGSAVILPEVFLKAVNVAHNLGYGLSGLTTVNMDFMRHYRARVNVVERPTGGTGTGISLIGHHEIMFPLLMAAVMEFLSGGDE
jgi:hypothetical protein